MGETKINIAIPDLDRKSAETPAGGVLHLEAGETLNLAAGEELTALTQDEMTAVCDKLHDFVSLNPDRAEGDDNTNDEVEIAAQMRERNGAPVIAKRTQPTSTKRHPLIGTTVWYSNTFGRWIAFILSKFFQQTFHYLSIEKARSRIFPVYREKTNESRTEQVHRGCMSFDDIYVGDLILSFLLLYFLPQKNYR